MCKMQRLFLGYGIIFLFSFICIAETPTEKAHGTPMTISSLPDNIRLIIGQEKDLFYSPRVKEIHQLSRNLPQDQIDACYEFLYQKIKTQSLPDLEFNGLKNELVFALMRQEHKPIELAGHLVKIYRDKSFDETWRDYCVQFFGKWYPNAPDNQSRKDMVDGLWHALKSERGNRIAGAAASQLCFLSKNYPATFDRAKVVAACREALNDPVCANISKVALLQACAELGDTEILPIARQLAAKEKDILLRASAIAAVGILGDSSDQRLLQELSASQDLRIQRPAKVASEKITHKSIIK